MQLRASRVALMVGDCRAFAERTSRWSSEIIDAVQFYQFRNFSISYGTRILLVTGMKGSDWAAFLQVKE
jgi:hypothetical protein